MKLLIKSIGRLSTSAIILTLTGCATIPPPPAMPSVSELVENSITSCSVTPSKDQLVTVKDGDVTISVNPEIAQSTEKKWNAVVIGGPYRLPPETPSSCWAGHKAALGGSYSGGSSFLFDPGFKCEVLDIKTSPYYSPVVRKLHFNIVIKNQLPIPLRLDSSIIAIYIGKEKMPPEDYSADYERLRKELILPGQEHSFKFADSGILNTFTDDTKIQIGIYDIPVKVNENSESVKKGRWTFNFDYACTKEVKKELPIVTRRARLIGLSGEILKIYDSP